MHWTSIRSRSTLSLPSQFSQNVVLGERGGMCLVRRDRNVAEPSIWKVLLWCEWSSWSWNNSTLRAAYGTAWSLVEDWLSQVVANVKYADKIGIIRTLIYAKTCSALGCIHIPLYLPPLNCCLQCPRAVGWLQMSGLYFAIYIMLHTQPWMAMCSNQWNFFYLKCAVTEVGIGVIIPQVIIKGPGQITEWLLATCSILLTALLQMSVSGKLPY
jgi:hypothetical protein